MRRPVARLYLSALASIAAQRQEGRWRLPGAGRGRGLTRFVRFQQADEGFSNSTPGMVAQRREFLNASERGSEAVTAVSRVEPCSAQIPLLTS